VAYENARLNGLFSSLRDAGPDFWGRWVIERHSGKFGLSEIDNLLESPDDRAGALGFGLNQKPPAALRKFNKTLDLQRLHDIAEKLIREQTNDQPRSRVETVGGKDVLLVQRFDREKTSKGYFRARMISGLTVLQAEESPLQRERWSYVLIAEEIRRIVAEPKGAMLPKYESGVDRR